MAKRVKGITVEIGGNTSGLSKALENAKSESKSLSKELRSVNAALKLDPTNVDLLKQRQDLYKESIDQTKEKLKALKLTKEKVDKDMANGTEINEKQYRELQREISFTESSLKKLEKQSDSASKEFSILGKKSEELEAGMKKISKVASVGVIAVGTASVKASLDFDDALAKVSTISDEQEMSLDTMKEKILVLSKETGIAAADIANNVYDAISAGQKTGEAVNFVGNSTKLAKAGFAEAGQSLDLLTTILNAYGVESEKATEISDMLIETQNKGKVTVGELSTSMGKIIPTAKGFKVSLDQICTGYAIMTSKGIKSAETTTYMNSMLNELGKSGTKASKIIKEKTGKSFQDLMSDGKTLGDVLKILDDNAKANNQSLSDMFGSADAGKAALTLLSNGSQSFNNSLKYMNNSTGATQKALEKLQTPAERVRKQLNELKIKSIELGDKLQPVFEIVQNFFGYLIKHSDKVIKSVSAVGAGLLTWNVVSMIQRVIKAIQGMTVAIQAAKTAQAAFNVTMTSSGFGLIAAAIGTVVTALILFSQKSDDAKTDIELLTETVKEDADAWKQLKIAQDEQIQAGVGELDYVKRLYDELQNLTDAQGNIIDNKDRVLFIVKEINKIMPDTIEYVNEEKITYKKTADEIDTYVQKKRAQIILEAREGRYKEAVTKIEGKRVEQVKLANELYQKQIKYQKLYEEWLNSPRNGPMIEIQRMMNLSDEIKALEDTYSTNEVLVRDYYQTINQFESDSAAISSNNLEEIKRINNGVSESFRITGEETLEELKIKRESLKTELELSRQRLKDGVAGVTTETVTGLEKMIEEADKKILEATPTFEEAGKATVEGLVAGIEKKAPSFGDALIKTVKDSNVSLSEFLQGKDFEDDCTEIAGFMIAGINEGIYGKSPALETALKTAMENARRGILKQEEIHSPSKKYERQIGVHLLPGVARGVEKTQPILQKALSNSMNKARKAINTYGKISMGIPNALTGIQGIAARAEQPAGGTVINISDTKVFSMEDVNKLGSALVKYIKRAGG